MLDLSARPQTQSDKARDDLLDAAITALAWLERNTRGDNAEAQKLRAAIAEVADPRQASAAWPLGVLPGWCDKA